MDPTPEEETVMEGDARVDPVDEDCKFVPAVPDNTTPSSCFTVKTGLPPAEDVLKFVDTAVVMVDKVGL